MRSGWSGSLVYLLAVFHRSSLAVAGLAATDRFDISASQLATFTMLQLLVYAGMQIPVGLLVDRFGSRSVLLCGTVLLTLAQAGFALAESYPAALIARVFVGMGDAMTFICVLRLVSSWFPARRIPLMTQLTGTLGQLGAIGAAIPMTWALSHLGWTHAYLLAASLGVLLAVGCAARAAGHARAQAPARAGDVAAGGPRQPGRVLVPPRHPARLLDALLDAVQRHRAQPAVGLPVLRPGRGAVSSTAGLLLTLMVVAVMAAGPDPRLAGRGPPVAPLHDGADHRLDHRGRLDRRAGLARPRADSGCWWSWPSWSASAVRPR